MTTEQEITTDATTYTDKQLKILLLKDSEYFLFVLYDRFAAPLYSAILKLVGCTVKAEDILMHTFLKAHNNPRLLQDASFSLFVSLLRISLQLCLNEKKENGNMIVREDILAIFFPQRWAAKQERRFEMLN
jgi:DNA-directed RNA polymerase specialized sigma24 family protein